MSFIIPEHNVCPMIFKKQVYFQNCGIQKVLRVLKKTYADQSKIHPGCWRNFKKPHISIRQKLYRYTLFSFHKNNFIRTSRLKSGLKIFQKL